MSRVVISVDDTARVAAKLRAHFVPKESFQPDDGVLGFIDGFQIMVDEGFIKMLRPRNPHTLYRKRIKRTDKTRRRSTR